MPTNWVIDDFILIQESGGNILMEDDDYIARQEWNSTTWTEQTTTGDG
jgi:hypothetical protein